MTARHIRTAGKRALPMKAMRTRTVEKSGERGYALLVVLFLVTLLVISAAAVAPNILTAGRREKEKEMIWRGKQYTRGVKLYYRKLGRFPTSLDDLTKPKLGSLRFMRQQYKDPMNKEDGAWRFIYVGPAGQLIGSLKPPQQNLTLPQIGAAIGTPASALNGPNTPAQPGGIGGQGGLLPSASSSTTASGATGTPVSADQGTPGSNGSAIPSGDTPTIVGGNIIGVGSKINKSSIIVYEKAKNYRLFEFVWDPSKDRIGAGQPGIQTGTVLGQPAGQPIGQQPGQNPGNSPQNPPLNPQQPPQNPPQQF
jgi:type II secretory pathway pseudopilin PulG